jgi:hypothetical protein
MGLFRKTEYRIIKKRDKRLQRLQVVGIVLLLLIMGCSYNNSDEICTSNYQGCLEQCEESANGGEIVSCKNNCYQDYLNCRHQMLLPTPPNHGF